MIELRGNHRFKQKTLRIVEFVGLAGSGKTTIIKALSQRNENCLIGDELQLKKREHIPIFIGHVPFLLPVFLRKSRSSRWFTWDEIKALVYLHQADQIFVRQAKSKGTMILLDHGPVFKLAKLNAFGPESLKNKRFEMWWQSMFEQWAFTLDMVIWLEAPDTILKERINTREQRHVVKERSEEEAYQFLASYRRSYEQIMAKLRDSDGPTLLKFDTYQTSIDQIVDEVSTAFDLTPIKN